jgi:hypothetical protein
MNDRPPTPNEAATVRRLAGAGVQSRMRINIAKTATKGYTADTTVEVLWHGDDVGDDVVVGERVTRLLVDADDMARREITRREQRDGASA